MGDFAYVDTGVAPLAIAALARSPPVLGRSLNVLARATRRPPCSGFPCDTRGLRLRPRRAADLHRRDDGRNRRFRRTGGSALVRIVAGADHRVVVPGAALAGGTLLVLADLVARTAIAPRQLPVGAITALVGVPLFLVLLQRQDGARIRAVHVFSDERSMNRP